MAVYADENLENPIRTLIEPWDGHTHKEVESYISGILAELSSEVSITLNIGIVGSDNRVFLVDDTTATFQYTVEYAIDGSPSTNYSVNIKIGNTVIQSGYKPGVSSSVAITSPELINYLKQRGNSTTVTVEVYDDDTGISRSRSVTFSKRQARLTSNNALGAVWTTANPITLSYTRNMDYGSLDSSNIQNAYIESVFSDSAGSTQTIQTTIAKESQLSGTTNVVIPGDLPNGNCTVTSRLVLGDPQQTSGNTVTDSLIITHDGTDGISADPNGTVYISAGLSGSAVVNNYADVEYKIYVVGGSGTLQRPVALQKQSNGVYVTQAIINVSNNSKETWEYFVTDALTTLRIVVPSVDGEGHIIYSSGQTLSMGAVQTLSFTATSSNIEWQTTSSGLVFALSAQNKSNKDYNLGEWSDNGYSMLSQDMQWDGVGSGWGKATYKDDNGNSLTSNVFRLIGKSRSWIDGFYPFYKDVSYSSVEHVGGGILSTGMTLKISFMASNVSNPDEKLIQCYDGTLGF